MENKTISSLANPEIKFISSLKKNTNRRKSKKTIAEGYRENKSLFESGRTVECLYICKELVRDGDGKELIDGFRSRGVRIVEVLEKPFIHISYRDKPDGFISIFPIYEQKLTDLGVEDMKRILIADKIEKPGNLGAMLRSAKAFGFNTVLVCDEKTNIFNPNVIRSSIGHIFSMNVVTLPSQEAIEFLNHNNVEIILLDPQSQESIKSFHTSKRISLVVGSEDKGLSNNWLNSKHTPLRIDSSAEIDSINASNAAAIAMWELSEY